MSKLQVVDPIYEMLRVSHFRMLSVAQIRTHMYMYAAYELTPPIIETNSFTV